MADIVSEAEAGVEKTVTKIESWWDKVAVPELTRDEQELVSLVTPLFAAVEASVLQDLKQFATGVATAVKAADGDLSLAGLETAVLNGLSASSSNLLPTFRSLGSNLIQVFLGLIVSKL